MKEVITKIDIQDKDLELVVKEKNLGSLITNANQIKDFVKSVLPNYSIDNYNEDNIDLAKKDKAMLNNASKLLNAKRIELEKEFNKPFLEFKDVVSETVKLISDCVSQIDSVVKESEQKAKELKKQQIVEYWNSKNFNIIQFDKIFNESWLNKTTSLKSVFAEIDTKIETINNELTSLNVFNDDAELLKSIYLDTLNISTTIQYGNKLIENRKKIAVPKPEAIPNTTSQEPAKQPEPVPTSKGEKTEMLTRAFKVVATRENIIALSNFMNEKGISFQKIEL